MPLLSKVLFKDKNGAWFLSYENYFGVDSKSRVGGAGVDAKLLTKILSQNHLLIPT